MESTRRSTFSGKLGFVLAAAGSAGASCFYKTLRFVEFYFLRREE